MKVYRGEGGYASLNYKRRDSERFCLTKGGREGDYRRTVVTAKKLSSLRHQQRKEGWRGISPF